MQNTQDRFYTIRGKRRILVVDDEFINREMLGAYLQSCYEVLYACDGKEAMQMIRENKETLSLVLLDILMPVMSGIDVLRAMKEDKQLYRIPVIVLTADQESEVKCLQLGAADFIPKPYPAVGVIHARIRRTIELSEDRDTIRSTERDALTGLFTKEYFYRYARQYDRHHEDSAMDAVVLDVNHFHLINERYGKDYGDRMLRTIGEKLKEFFGGDGRFACRLEADTFLVYCVHRDDYKKIMDTITDSLTARKDSRSRVRLRMGVYSDADRSIDIERRFDRAKMAATSIRENFARSIAYYDNDFHERELYAEQLVEDFDTALREKQFILYYQPKYDIRAEQPVLSGTEALVRWIHPRLGMVSPEVFVPLFEENGLVRELDRYVWREACRQVHEWKEKLGMYVPVSVNVSRIDLYDPDLLSVLQDLIREYGLSYGDITLEVTESAYTSDTEQITDVVERLRKIGFKIEIDDFGTGYSSLNMVTALPFDVLKVDMQFIRGAFREGGDTRMLELIIDIADYLSVPVIAEGVETMEQMHALKAMGCEMVQGYYFSRPVPANQFETFILDKGMAAGANAAPLPELEEAVPFGDQAQSAQPPAAETPAAGSSDAGSSAAGLSAAGSSVKDYGVLQEEPVPAPKAEETKPARKRSFSLHLRTATRFFLIIALLAAAALFAADIAVARGYERMEKASDRYIAAQMSANDMEAGSDYLTDRVRCFVVNGDLQYLEDFFEEVEVTRRRDKAVEDLEALLDDHHYGSGALKSLRTALSLSNELLETEYEAMLLKLDSGDYDPAKIPQALAALTLSEEDMALSAQEKNDKARTILFDSHYMQYKDRIRENVNECTQELIRYSRSELDTASSRLGFLVSVLTAMTVVFLLIVLIIVLFINEQIRKPLSQMVERMRRQEMIPPTGAEELQFVTRTYNTILEENRAAREKLRHEASHDALTGLFNRGAYDLLMQSVDTSHIALIIVDVDYFKSVNDTYGHAVGDRVLKRVAEILRHSFRSVDIICRIGGDEFVVIMTRVNSSMRQLVVNKINQANEILQHPKDDLPPVSLSVGVAFSDRDNPRGDIFKDADTALYRVKEAGRNGCEVY